MRARRSAASNWHLPIPAHVKSLLFMRIHAPLDDFDGGIVVIFIAEYFVTARVFVFCICILGNEQTLFCAQRAEFSNGTEINTLYIFVLIMGRAPSILCYLGVPVLSAPFSKLPAQNSADLM